MQDDSGNEIEDSGTPLRQMVTRSKGMHLPEAVLQEALGRRANRAFGATGLCVAIGTRHSTWVKPLVTAAKRLADWSFVFDGGTSPRQRAEQERDALEWLARGARVLCVGASHGGIPPRLLAAADIAVDVDRLTLAAVSRAIRLATDSRPRGLRQEDVEGLDLIDAMAAIRPRSTAGSCIKRIRAAHATTNHDPYVSSSPPIEELAGYGEARVWADELIIDLERWRRGELGFSSLQRNVVLAGAPGVGKSTFVRSLARSTGLPLFSSSIGQMFASTAGYLDSIVKAIDELFANARSSGDTAIVFLDELEGIPNRATLDGRHASWWTPVVNHLLTTLDSAMSAASSQLIVIGATNFPDKIDAALVRPGRMDRIIWIEHPDAVALACIFRQHLGTDLPNADLSGVAELAVGSTGADVVGHVRAARAKARSCGETLSLLHLIDAICPPSTLSEADLRRAALHESGHAVAAAVLGGHKVCNIMLGDIGESGGRVTFERSQSISGAAEKRIEIVQLLAGRAAEECFMGSISAGAGGADDSDLGRATRIVAASHLSYGLRGTLTYLAEPSEALMVVRRIPELWRLVEQELQQHYADALDLMRANEDAVIAVAAVLVDRRMMTGDDLRRIVEQEKSSKVGADRAGEPS